MNNRTISLSLIALVILGGLGIWFYYSVTNRATTTGPVSAEVPVGTASLMIDPTELKTAKVGVPFTVNVVVDTKGDKTSGIDLAMQYDPTVLEIVDADTKTNGVQITDGGLLPVTPYNEVKDKSISFSTVQSADGQPKALKGKLASITFKPKAAGTSQIKFEYTPGLLSDTNIIKATDGRDLLSSVTGSTITVSQ